MEFREETFHVSGNQTRERLDTYLAEKLTQSSRSQIQKLIKSGLVTVNGRAVRANHLVRPLEAVAVRIPRNETPDVLPESIPLDVVFEDSFLIVVNKPPGMVVHPAYGHQTGTLVNALLAHCGDLSGINDPVRPGIVHRLDMDTSGLLVAAKNDRVHRQLALQFHEKSVQREYIALVWGALRPRQGTIETYLSRSLSDRRKITVSGRGKMAVTHYRVLESFHLFSLLSLRLGTGRTHQIRVHLSHLGHPVFGDQTYGGRGRRLGGLNRAETALAVEWLEALPRQALHARTLGFVHPETGETLLFESDLPPDMAGLLDRIRKAETLFSRGSEAPRQ
ncbi:RluA family pseudouridine synthase [bacterium]|nr:RluA family pseudouridine synthase [bacterium]